MLLITLILVASLTAAMVPPQEHGIVECMSARLAAYKLMPDSNKVDRTIISNRSLWEQTKSNPTDKILIDRDMFPDETIVAPIAGVIDTSQSSESSQSQPEASITGLSSLLETNNNGMSAYNNNHNNPLSIVILRHRVADNNINQRILDDSWLTLPPDGRYNWPEQYGQLRRNRRSLTVWRKMSQIFGRKKPEPLAAPALVSPTVRVVSTNQSLLESLIQKSYLLFSEDGDTSGTNSSSNYYKTINMNDNQLLDYPRNSVASMSGQNNQMNSAQFLEEQDYQQNNFDGSIIEGAGGTMGRLRRRPADSTSHRCHLNPISCFTNGQAINFKHH